MPARPLTRKLLRDVLRLRGQMLAIALVVASGIALFVTMRSMRGYLLGAMATYYAEYRFADVFSSLERAPAPVAAEAARIPGVGAVEARIVTEVALDVPSLAEPATGRLVSIPDRGEPALERLHMRRGRRPEPDRRDEVVVSDAFAQANRLAPGDSIGAVLGGRWETLRIVGVAISPEFVYEIASGGIFPDSRRFGVIWMGHDALAGALDMRGAFNDLQLGLAPGGREADVIVALDALLERYGGRGAYGRDDHVSHGFLRDEISETRVTSVILPAIFLGVTAFLLHMVLSRLVNTQREQIAVLKAFGYGNGALGAHYLQLAMVPVGAGIVLGGALGLWFAGGLATVYARFFRFPDAHFEPSWGVVVAAVLIGGGAALVGALGAVRRAAALPPAEAMRPESPPRFRAGVLERAGVLRALSVPARIVARNLERRPGKAALTIFALALAVGILFVTRWMFDAVAFLERVQFAEVQREDVTVVFETPRPARAAYALARLPGVRRVEPFRVVPVKLASARHSYRTALTGLSPDGELHRIVGERMVAQPVPVSGVMLTRQLAERLGVDVGKMVTIASLEGDRWKRDVQVTALADELLGLNAYMSAAELSRLAGEQEALSGAWLRVDPREAAALYARLKRLPAVSGVAVREASLESFRRTIAESFTISLVVTILFACVIAVGIVYNGARISLSERGRELASLRVLGFSRREVTAMLLGEQALLTLMALPVGFAIGLALCALLVVRFATDLYRIPLVVQPGAYLFASAIVIGAAVLSGIIVGAQARRLDLVAVLKTRE